MYLLLTASIAIWNLGSFHLFTAQHPGEALFWARFLFNGCIVGVAAFFHLAMIVAGFMSRRGGMAGQGPAGGLGDLVGGMLGGRAPGTTSPRAGGLGGLLDMDGNGNPLDDILRMAGRIIR